MQTSRLAALSAAGLLLSAPLFGQQPTQAPSTGTGLILGSIVDADTGRGVSGSLVTLAPYVPPPASVGELTEARPPAPPSTLLSAPNPLVRRVLTAADGRFLFRDLAKGSFAIYASSPRYLGGAYGQLRPQGPAVPVDLGDGQKLGGLTVRLWRFGSISGSVRDEHGEPAAGVGVECSRRVFTGGQPRLASAGVANYTDDRGLYRVGNLSPGDYVCGNVLNPSTVPVSVSVISAAAPRGGGDPEVSRRLSNSGATTAVAGARIGEFIYTSGGTQRGPAPPPADATGRMLVYAPQFYSGAPTTSQASVITVKSGEDRTGIDIQLRLVPSARVSGRLIGPDGPMPFFGLRLVPVSGNDMVSEGQAEFSRTTTDPSGAFTFLGVPAGEYVLKGRLFPRPTPGGNVAAAFEEPSFWTATPVTVGSTDVTNLTIQLSHGLRVSGRVEFAGARSVTPAEIQRVALRMQNAEGRTSSPVALEGRVQADGTFKTSGYPAGRYIASILPNTTPPGWWLRTIQLNGRDVSTEPFDITNANVTGLTVVFTDKTTTISGSVSGPKGPDGAQEVVVFPADSMAWKEIGPVARRTRVERVERNGAFSIAGLPPGDYFVAAISGAFAGDRQDPSFLAKLIGEARRVSLADGGTASVQLTVKR